MIGSVNYLCDKGYTVVFPAKGRGSAYIQRGDKRSYLEDRNGLYYLKVDLGEKKSAVPSRSWSRSPRRNIQVNSLPAEVSFDDMMAPFEDGLADGEAVGPPPHNDKEDEEVLEHAVALNDAAQEPFVNTGREKSMPTKEVINEHIATGHANFADWCDVCKECQANDLPHIRQGPRESEIPLITMDYFFMTTGPPRKDDKNEQNTLDPGTVTCLSAYDTQSRATFCTMVNTKGSKDRYACRFAAQFLESFGIQTCDLADGPRELHHGLGKVSEKTCDM
jgi:hypothetical protein